MRFLGGMDTTTKPHSTHRRFSQGRSHGPHRRVVGIRPQSRLFLSGVTPLRGHYTSSEMV